MKRVPTRTSFPNEREMFLPSWRRARDGFVNHQKVAQLFLPLVEQRFPVHQYQRVDFPLGNHCNGKHGLPKGGCGRQRANGMGKHGGHSLLLLFTKSAFERHVNGSSVAGLVVYMTGYIVYRKQFRHILFASTRQSKIMVCQF